MHSADLALLMSHVRVAFSMDDTDRVGKNK